MAKKDDDKILRNFGLGLLIAIVSWAIFDLARMLSIRLLENNGVTNPLNQSIILVVVGLIILGLVFGIRGAIKQISR